MVQLNKNWWNDWGKFAAPRLVIVILSLIMFWYNDNWKAIGYPPVQPHEAGGLWSILLTPLNVVLVGFGVTIALVILLFLLIRVLFSPLEEVTVFGVGYKTRSKITHEAVQEMDVYRKIDVLRMTIIDVLGEPEFSGKISANYNRETGAFEEYMTLMALCDLLETSYHGYIEELDLSTGVVAVENGAIDPSHLNNVSTDIRNVLNKCFRGNEPVNEKGRILAVPLKLEEGDSVYCILYLKNSGKIFNDADELFVKNLWRIIKSEVHLIILDSALTENLEEIPG